MYRAVQVMKLSPQSKSHQERLSQQVTAAHAAGARGSNRAEVATSLFIAAENALGDARAAIAAVDVANGVSSQPGRCPADLPMGTMVAHDL